jgi:hypothetical protein
MSKKQIIRDLVEVILEWNLENGDDDVQELITRAARAADVKVPSSNSAMIEAIRQANINPLAP